MQVTSKQGPKQVLFGPEIKQEEKMSGRKGKNTEKQEAEETVDSITWTPSLISCSGNAAFQSVFLAVLAVPACHGV